MNWIPGTYSLMHNERIVAKFTITPDHHFIAEQGWNFLPKTGQIDVDMTRWLYAIQHNPYYSIVKAEQA